MTANTGHRVDWVDYAKGFCIVFVVMMHSTLGVGIAAGQEGWMHYVVAFAKPFRMPDFFLISGLFLSRVIDRDWLAYADRKIVHFAYFYVLWMTIQFLIKAPVLTAEYGLLGAGRAYLEGFIEPFGTLWFIYLLPIFFAVTKLTRKVPPAIVWIIAALLESSRLHTGWTIPDEFASRFVYFYTGYILAPYIFTVAKDVQDAPLKGIAIIAAWSIANGYMVFAGYSEYPGISLALGLIGAAAVVRFAALLSRARVRFPALFRPALDRHLSRLLPAHGGDAHDPAPHRHRAGHRHDLAARHDHRRARRNWNLVGLARNAAEVPLRAAQGIPPRPARQSADAAAGGIAIHSAAALH